MKKLVFLFVTTVLVLGGVQTGFPWGCPWMNGSNWYGAGQNSRSYGIWQSPLNGSMFNGQVYPRNFWNGGMSQWFGIPYNELTPDQQKSLLTLDRKYEKKILQMEKDIQIKHLELESLQLDDEPDGEAIGKKQKEIEKAESPLDKVIDEYQVEVTKILPENVIQYFDDRYTWREYWTGPGGYCPMWW